MSQQITPSNEQEPLIPPRYLLILSALGFLVALIVKATQPEFGVVGYGGLAFGVLALLMWVLLAPDQARGVLTGRTARFGGTSLLVTVLLLAVLIGVYAVVRNANLRVDLTQADNYSLTPESQQAIAALAAEPGTPKVKIVAFYGPSQASSRDQDSLLFEDYKQTSNGKIDYEFVDPEQQPQTVSQYGVSRAGQIAVVKLNDDGTPDTQNAQIVNTFGQGDITNAILKVSSSGVFNAYFLTVNDGIGDKMTVLKQNLTNRYGWHVQDVSLAQLTSPDGQFNLDDPNVTGQVIIDPRRQRAAGGRRTASAGRLRQQRWRPDHPRRDESERHADLAGDRRQPLQLPDAELRAGVQQGRGDRQDAGVPVAADPGDDQSVDRRHSSRPTASPPVRARWCSKSPTASRLPTRRRPTSP